MKNGIVFLLFVLLVLPARIVAGQGSSGRAMPQGHSTLRVSPNSLAPLVEDQGVRMMLRDGTYVEGKVVYATEETLTVKVKHSEPAGRLKKGENAIRTSDISVVYLKKRGPIALPIALGVAGGFGGAIVGAYAGYATGSPSGLVALGIGMTSVGATCGALLGAEAAKKTVTISVAPKSQVPGME